MTTNRFRELLTSWPLKSALSVDECETIREALMMSSGASANEEETKLARVCAHCSAALREADEVAAELRQTVARQAATIGEYQEEFRLLKSEKEHLENKALNDDEQMAQ